MIRLEQYGSKNLRKLITDKYTIWFSYETPIAIEADTGRLYKTFVSKNEWSNTTGKHLNIIKREVNEYAEIKHRDVLEIIEECIRGD